MWCVCTLEYYSEIQRRDYQCMQQMDSRNIMPSERGQTQRCTEYDSLI